MPITTLKVLSTVLQLHGPGATIQSDHQGIDALLSDLRGQNAEADPGIFQARRFVRGGGEAAAFAGRDIMAAADFAGAGSSEVLGFVRNFLVPTRYRHVG